MFSPSVSHALFDGRLHIGRERCDIERLACTNTDLRKPLHKRGFRRNGGANLQDEVQDVEELRRRPLLRWRKRLDEIDGWCGLRRSLSEKRRERLHLVAG